MLNNEQAKYLADSIRIAGIAQFGYFGYRSLESPDHALFYVSGFIFVLAVVIGTFILAIPRSKDDGKY
jgi:hypothetical protein